MYRLQLDGLSWQELDGEIVALDVRNSVYITTNRTGTFMWHLLVAGIGEAALVKALQDRYELDLDRARSDVQAFIDRLRLHDLIEASPTQAS